MLREGDEPIPGYILTRFLGKGTFGEVWQARTAGGFRAALKFVDLSVSSGLKEYRGIQRVKDIRHGRLMLMTALWMLDKHGGVIPDQLLAEFDSSGSGAQANIRGTLAVTPMLPSMFVVAMPLADKSLLDLLEASGGRGIPLPDLMRYMEHAAEGLDFLNDPVHDLGEGQPVAIQHCDIKPANIMIMGNAAVICDFGLARILQADGMHRSVSGMAGTYPYMAPECIESPLADRAPQPSFASDQYSLAVTYVELRTGRLPFHDEDLNSHLAILRAHCEGRLSLDGLPEAERKVIAKATSINPSDRYPSNAKLVRHLRRAVRAELDKAQELDPEASGDYSGTKVSRSSAQRARADTDRVRETVPIPKPAAAPRRFRRLALVLLPLVAAVVGGALLWNKWTPEARDAGPGTVTATPAEPGTVPEPAKTPENDAKQPVTPQAPETTTPAEKPDPATRVAKLLAQAEQHAKCLADPTAKDGDWRAAHAGFLALMKDVAEVEHSTAAQAQRAIQLQLARIDARKQQWAAMFVRLNQVADPQQPTELSQLTPRDQALYRALQALGNANADARIVLEYLAAAVDPVGGAEQLDPWEAQQIAALKDATRPHIEQMLPLADPYDKLCDRVWPEGIAFEVLLRRAGDSLAQDKFSAARAALDDAQPLAKSAAEQRQLEWHAALLAARDPDVSAAEALDAFRRTAPAATHEWQARLTTAMIERIEQLDTAELTQWSRMVQEASENYFKLDEGAAPDDPRSVRARDCRVQLHLRLGEALAQQADQQHHGAAAKNQTTAETDQLLKLAETSATAAIELLPKSIAAGPERKSKSRAAGILGRVYYVQFKAADPSQREQPCTMAITNLDQAILLADSVDDSALWRILLGDVQLQLARALEPELKRIQDKIAKLTLPADKKAVSERDEKPLLAERDRLLKQAQAALQPIPPTNPHRQHAPALFKALNVP